MKNESQKTVLNSPVSFCGGGGEGGVLGLTNDPNTHEGNQTVGKPF